MPAFIEVLPGLVETMVGRTVTIECSVEGRPTPAISWLKDAKPLLPAPNHVSLSYDGECATLKLIVTNIEDSGRYTCVANNDAGEAR